MPDGSAVAGLTLDLQQRSTKEKYDKLIAGGLVPAGRWGYPEDIAKVILSLCDGTYGYTTGQSVIVDGGMHIRRL